MGATDETFPSIVLLIGGLAIADMPPAPTMALPSTVRNSAEPLSLEHFWPFFTPRQSPRQGPSLRRMTRREQALSAEVARYAAEMRSLQQQLVEKAPGTGLCCA